VRPVLGTSLPAGQPHGRRTWAAPKRRPRLAGPPAGRAGGDGLGRLRLAAAGDAAGGAPPGAPGDPTRSEHGYLPLLQVMVAGYGLGFAAAVSMACSSSAFKVEALGIGDVGRARPGQRRLATATDQYRRNVGHHPVDQPSCQERAAKVGPPSSRTARTPRSLSAFSNRSDSGRQPPAAAARSPHGRPDARHRRPHLPQTEDGRVMPPKRSRGANPPISYQIVRGELSRRYRTVTPRSPGRSWTRPTSTACSTGSATSASSS
jgi:hypothetical protein